MRSCARWRDGPDAKLLELLALDGASYRAHEVFGGERMVRAVPFDAIELDLGDLWK
jgi:hypothetical protein